MSDSSPLSPSHWKLAASVVAELRSHIATVTRLTASAGIAPNMMLAKVASDINKPDGQYLVEPCRERILQFVRQLPIRKVYACTSVYTLIRRHTQRPFFDCP